MHVSKKSLVVWMWAISLCFNVSPFGHAAGSAYLDRADRLNGWNTRSVFEPLYEKHRASVVEILEDGHQIALGTVVSEDGYIVTKASEFGMALEVRDADHHVFVPESISVDSENDLALLKIKAVGMKPVQWSDETPSMGQWLISPHEDETQVRVGVVSAPLRAIPKKPGALGIEMVNAADTLTPNSFLNFASFRSRVEQQERPLDRFLAERLFQDDERDDDVADGNQDLQKARIIEWLNRALFRNVFYEEGLLEGIPLSAATKEMMEESDQRAYRSVLNLMVLEDAFSDLIVRRQKGGLITRVRPESGAEKAGVSPEDLIVAVEGETMMTSGDVIQKVQKYGPGEKIKLQIRRGDQDLNKTVTLGYFDATFPEQDVNIELSGDISVRRTGYDQAIQHEIPLPPKAMGGPLMNLEGKVVGVNISRFDRVTTFALPAELVRSTIEKLK